MGCDCFDLNLAAYCRPSAAYCRALISEHCCGGVVLLLPHLQSKCMVCVLKKGVNMVVQCESVAS